MNVELALHSRMGKSARVRAAQVDLRYWRISAKSKLWLTGACVEYAVREVREVHGGAEESWVWSRRPARSGNSRARDVELLARVRSQRYPTVYGVGEASGLKHCDKVTPPLPFAPPSPSPLASPRPPSSPAVLDRLPTVIACALFSYGNVDSERSLAAPKSGGRAAATS
ncbi:hypothetical protein C8R44DRAFT_754087 [Mycena epipterygia]|nr:hypothetical protein C8R44DRAFT_754087 [Mycena epipterygia]